MSPHHFSKQMHSPYFQSKHYREESAEAKVQAEIEGFILKCLNPIKRIFKKRNKNVQS
jgi:hypothetical protein